MIARPSPGERARPGWILSVVVTAVFMVTLDNLVVTTALANIRDGLGASLVHLEWVVNAYTVSFASLMLLSSAVADRYGHRRVFLGGLLIFTGSSAAAAASPSIDALIAARAVQGLGAAVILPLSLTLLAAAFPADRRGLALGIFSGVSGLGVALGPLVGGALVQAGSWQAIFWLNVPVGVALLALTALVLAPGQAGSRSRIDLVGATLVTAGLVGVLVALVSVQHSPWSSPEVFLPLLTGIALLAGFVGWEARTPEPILPLRFFRSQRFVAVNLVNVAMYFGMFGAIFLLAPFLQTVLGDSPWQAGIRILPWTLMPLLISPFAGVFTDRIGARTLVVVGMAMQAAAIAWIALDLQASMSFLALLGPCALGGIGMALVYPPIAATLLASVQQDEVAPASAAMNSFRETGGAVGIAVLATMFTLAGGDTTPAGYLAGLRPALIVAAAVLVLGAVAAGRLPGRASRPARVAAVTAGVTR